MAATLAAGLWGIETCAEPTQELTGTSVVS
ncbi:MAG: hypothetical protein KZQ78_04670 [Candidatus Thiodiazotropha sp. (ex Ustalcina ferruginea)]|nr:hypothetical protein [Candidatus Thiodiazotropha sp. (ex Ustalcina ferruginea)]